MKKAIVPALMALTAAVCLWLFAAFPQTEPTSTPTPGPSAIPVLTPAPTDLTSLSWDYAARTLRFVREDGAWTYPDDKRFPLDADSPRFAALFDALERLTAQRYLPQIADPAEFGLDAPTTVITFTRTDGAETTLTVGGQNPVTLDYYLQTAGDPGVYVIDDALPRAFACGLFDLVKTDPMPDLSGASAYSCGKVTLHRTADGQWLDEQDAPADDLTPLLSGLSYGPCIDYYADSDEVQAHEYGLKTGRTVTVTYPENGADGVWQLVIGNDYDEHNVIVSPAGSHLVYLLPRSIADALPGA